MERGSLKRASLHFAIAIVDYLECKESLKSEYETLLQAVGSRTPKQTIFHCLGTLGSVHAGDNVTINGCYVRSGECPQPQGLGTNPASHVVGSL
jgi:hypothetical protein